jgi:hypothetical protein
MHTGVDRDLDSCTMINKETTRYNDQGGQIAMSGNPVRLG